MKYLLKTIFIFIFLLYPSLVITAPKNIIFEANGIGESESIAINNALDLLSQQIYVSVESAIKSREKLINNSYSSEVENNSVLLSRGYFHNIQIYNKKTSKKKGVELTVGLSSDSITSSIDYLFLQIESDDIHSLSKSKLRERLYMANFLFSLISYAKANNIVYHKNSINLDDYISNSNKILNSDSSIKFIVFPKDIDISIKIENTLYKPYKNIYLGKGKYVYKVDANGYNTIQNTIEVTKGDNLEIELFLQKKLKNKIPVRIKIINETDIDTKILIKNYSNLISKNQMLESSNSNNFIEFHFTENKSQSVIAGYNNSSVSVFIKSYINKVEKNELLSINNLSKNNINSLSQNKIINQINEKSQIFFAKLFD